MSQANHSNKRIVSKKLLWCFYVEINGTQVIKGIFLILGFLLAKPAFHH